MTFPSFTFSHSLKPWGAKTMTIAMLKPTHPLAFKEGYVAGNDIGSAVLEMQQHIEEV